MDSTLSTLNTVYYNYSRADMLKFVELPMASALDVGCGSGNFLKILKKSYNSETWGIEPSKNCSPTDNVSVDKFFHGTWQDNISFLPESYFDGIFFNDVLEHLADPRLCLEEARNLLSPRGKVYASIPNFLFADNLTEIIASQDFKYQEAGILDKTHLRFFTRKSMIRMFSEAGYQVERIMPLTQVQTWKWRILLGISFGKLKEFSVFQYGIAASPLER